MGGLIIEAAAILNEDNPEFFSELMKKGVDAVEPEMKRQKAKREEEKFRCPRCNNKIWKSIEKGAIPLGENPKKDYERYNCHKCRLFLAKDDVNVRKVSHD